jgi:O-antigen ligase
MNNKKKIAAREKRFNLGTLSTTFLLLLGIIFFMPVSGIISIWGKTILFFLGAITGFFWLIELVHKNEKIRVSKWPTFFSVLLVLLAALSILWAQDQSYAIKNTLSLTSLVLLFIVFQNNVKDKERLKIVFFTIFISVSVFSVYSNLSIFEQGITISGATRLTIIAQQNPNNVAIVLGLGLLASPIVLANSRKKFKIIAFFCAVNIAIAIIFTASRGCWVSIALALILSWLISGKKIPIKQISYLVIFLVLAIGILAYTESTKDYIINRAIKSLDFAENKGGAGRVDIYLVGLEMVKDNFLFGVGSGNFQIRYRDYIDAATPQYVRLAYENIDAHNTFLIIQAETGIIGTILFVCLLVSMFKPLLIHKKDSLASSAITIFFFLIIFSIVLTTYWQPVLWIIFGLLATTKEIILNESQANATLSKKTTKRE